jgi:hypothetical protein
LLPRRSFLRPSRTRLAELRSLLTGARDAKDAWYRLVREGAIPASWFDDPARRFVNDPGDRYRTDRPTRDPASARHEAHPAVLEHCALFAADVDGVLAAESAARALAERLGPWGAPVCTRVVWWTIGRNDYGYASTDTRPGVHYALPFAFHALHGSLQEANYAVPSSPFGQAHECDLLWRGQAARGALLPGGGSGPSVPVSSGRSFAELPNPFEALARIEAAGYASLEYSSSAAQGGAVFLISPSED